MKNYIIYISLFILVSHSLFAQVVNQAEQFEIDVPVSWGAEYEAKNSIKFNTGFSYTNIDGQTFAAIINPDLTPLVEDGRDGDISNGLDAGFMNNSSAIAPPGSLAGSVNVSSSGAATYAIPLKFPNGIGGVNPNLSCL